MESGRSSANVAPSEPSQGVAAESLEQMSASEGGAPQPSHGAAAAVRVNGQEYEIEADDAISSDDEEDSSSEGGDEESSGSDGGGEEDSRSSANDACSEDGEDSEAVEEDDDVTKEFSAAWWRARLHYPLFPGKQHQSACSVEQVIFVLMEWRRRNKVNTTAFEEILQLLHRVLLPTTNYCPPTLYLIRKMIR